MLGRCNPLRLINTPKRGEFSILEIFRKKWRFICPQYFSNALFNLSPEGDLKEIWNILSGLSPFDDINLVLAPKQIYKVISFWILDRYILSLGSKKISCSFSRGTLWIFWCSSHHLTPDSHLERCNFFELTSCLSIPWTRDKK